MKGKIDTPSIRYLLLTGVLMVWVGCNPASAPTSDQASPLTERSMEAAYQTETASVEIPPIDLAAPAEVETDTFGLG